MRCICSSYGCAQKFFIKSNQILIILVSLNSLLYRNVVASGRARPRGLAPGQRSSKETSQRLLAVGYTMSDLTGLGIESKPSASIAKSFNTTLQSPVFLRNFIKI